MRKKKNLTQRITAREHLLCKSAEESADNPYAPFGITEIQKRALRLEIGCGKGSFICECALQNPDIGFYAFEKMSNVIVNAMEKADCAEIQNIRFVNADARELAKWFKPGSFDRIYINFCDPWPKVRHTKNRLTHTAFLGVYRELLAAGGELWLKTDNEDLFDFSLHQFADAGYTIIRSTRDLHASEYASQNIMTEYEKNFTARGMKIHFAVAVPAAVEA